MGPCAGGITTVMSSDLAPPPWAEPRFDALSADLIAQQRRSKAVKDNELREYYEEHYREPHYEWAERSNFNFGDYPGGNKHLTLSYGGFDFYRYYYHLSKPMQALAERECNHVWHLVLQPPGARKTMLWINAAKFENARSNYVVPVGIFEGNKESPFRVVCPADRLDQYRISITCQSPSTGEVYTRTFSLLDTIHGMDSAGLASDMNLEPDLSVVNMFGDTQLVATYTIDNPTPTTDADRELYIRIIDAIAQAARGVPQPQDAQGGSRAAARTAVIQALRTNFAGHVLRLSMWRIIYRQIPRAMSRSIHEAFVHQFPPAPY